MEESSTALTLQETGATSRAVTNDSISNARANHNPRPAPPPAPRPIVRSERAGLALSNQNYLPQPRPPSPYSDLIRQNLQSNHNGGKMESQLDVS